jgi:hypothetical protein
MPMIDVYASAGTFADPQRPREQARSDPDGGRGSSADPEFKQNMLRSSTRRPWRTSTATATTSEFRC